MVSCPSYASTVGTQEEFTWTSPVPAEATSTLAWPASFTTANVKTKLRDGYWIEAFPFRTSPLKSEGPLGPELIGYGLGEKTEDGKIQASEVKMYLNPFSQIKRQSKLSNEWDSITIKSFDYPVALTYGKFRKGEKLNDIIICHDYGASMDNLNEAGGIVSYLKNPGDRTRGDWEQRYIGKSPAMHRLKTGYFTQKKHLEIMALPIMVKSGDRTTPAPVIIYQPTKWDDNDENKAPSGWVEIKYHAVQDTFRLIHDVEIIHSTNGGLDKALVAGREGVNLIWVDEGSGEMKHENIGKGIPQSPKPLKNPYWGSGSVAAGRVGNDSVGYIASCEAFHGNIVSVYVKSPSTRSDDVITSQHWRRFVIDDFGDLKPGEFTGTIHNVQCADLDGSGVDSIIVACMGYPKGTAENMGTYVYKPCDLLCGQFTRHKISDDSAGRIAIADYRCSGTLDVATISYSVPNYLVTPNPALRILLNNTKYTRRAIKAQRLRDEVMIRVPHAVSAGYTSEIPLIDIAGKRLSIVVLPPHREYQLGTGPECEGYQYQADGVKVINGELSWTPASGSIVKRTIAVARQKAENMIPNSPDHIVKAGEAGAIFIRLASSISTSLQDLKYDNMHDVAIRNCLPPSADTVVRDMKFPWVKCEDRAWAPDGKFKWPFYNAVGFHVLYDDDSLTSFCHIQAWTLGVGQTAAFHNHDDKSFCEIHACISNGTGKGGMYWSKDQKRAEEHLRKNPDEKDPEKLKEHTDSVIVNDMQEHGPLWDINDKGLPSLRENDTVSYPYHAWIAGPYQETEAFDVWLAFEFPSSEFQPKVSKNSECAPR